MIYFVSRHTPSVVIPIAHEKSGALTGLKCDLAEQGWSMPILTSFWMPAHVL